MDFKRKGYQDGDWIHLAYNKNKRQILVNPIMKLLIPLTQGISSAIIRFSSTTLLHELV
jgi:hypothetical protein